MRLRPKLHQNYYDESLRILGRHAEVLISGYGAKHSVSIQDLNDRSKEINKDRNLRKLIYFGFAGRLNLMIFIIVCLGSIRFFKSGFLILSLLAGLFLYLFLYLFSRHLKRREEEFEEIEPILEKFAVDCKDLSKFIVDEPGNVTEIVHRKLTDMVIKQTNFRTLSLCQKVVPNFNPEDLDKEINQLLTLGAKFCLNDGDITPYENVARVKLRFGPRV